LNQDSKPGDVLKSAGISGLFHLPGTMEDIEQVFFFAAGTEKTPCYAIIKTLLATTRKKLVLIYSNRQEKETIFHQKLLLLQQQHPQQFHIRFIFSVSNDVDSRSLSNW